ncbi:hypothetical protein [Desulfosediminicola sp.]|uniref:hypothetical protein n=1 Tax=Desulfosediminicola sp. TaxID=2886825 RepID=UPI003AF28EF1
MPVSHGELVQAILVSGRHDINVLPLNTTITRGLAKVVIAVLQGKCIDAVVPSVPGSNYTYNQMSTLLGESGLLNPANLFDYRKDFMTILVDVAFSVFQSLEWLLAFNVNVVKLREDRFSGVCTLRQW